MTKSELIEILAKQQPSLSPMDVHSAVNTILDAIANALVNGERIEIRDFGSFQLNQRPPRVARNPKTGEKVNIPTKYVPHFKAGKELRQRVNVHHAESVKLIEPIT